jgi:hypothetical protein
MLIQAAIIWLTSIAIVLGEIERAPELPWHD